MAGKMIDGVTPAPNPDSAAGNASRETVSTIRQSVTPSPASPAGRWAPPDLAPGQKRWNDPAQLDGTRNTPDPTAWPADRSGHPSSVIPGDPTPRPYHPDDPSAVDGTPHRLFER